MSDPLYAAGDFESFWDEYQALHSHPGTRAAHLLGTSAALSLGLGGLATQTWWLLGAAPLVDYGIAQLSHRMIQGNATQPYRRPTWHVRAELRLARGTLREGLQRARARLRRRLSPR